MKLIRRNISEVDQAEKVQIHFEFNDQKKGYAEIAREHLLDNCDIYVIVQEIEKIRANRASNPKVKHVLRRVHVNKHRKEQKPVKAARSPRPDDRRKVVSRELDLNEEAQGYEDDYRKPERPRYQKPNQAMALAFQNAARK